MYDEDDETVEASENNLSDEAEEGWKVEVAVVSGEGSTVIDGLPKNIGFALLIIS